MAIRSQEELQELLHDSLKTVKDREFARMTVPRGRKRLVNYYPEDDFRPDVILYCRSNGATLSWFSLSPGSNRWREIRSVRDQGSTRSPSKTL